MEGRYKVSFEVEGDSIGDDAPLDEDNIKEVIMFDFDSSSSRYYGHMVYSRVSNLKVEKMKGGAHNGTTKEKSEGGSEGRSCC